MQKNRVYTTTTISINKDTFRKLLAKTEELESKLKIKIYPSNLANRLILENVDKIEI